MVIFLSPITRIVTHLWLSIGTQKTPHYREPILYLTFISTELYNFYTLYGAVSLIPLYIFWHSFLVLSLISAFPLAYDNCRHYYRNSEQKRDCRVWEPIQGV